jgi:hypothetical protein
MVLKVAGGGGGTAGAVNYLGTWNASTNNPTLSSGVGIKGGYYVVSTAGTTTLDGISLWSVGDWAVFNGTVWQKVNGSSSEAFANITITGLTGYMYANNTSPVTASTTIPVASVTGAVPNTVNVLASGLLTGGGALTGNVSIGLTSVPVANVPGAVPNTTYVNAGGLLTGGGQLTGNVTLSLTSVPSGNVSGLGTMAVQNANAVAITGGTINSVSHTGGTYANANITSVAATFPNSYLSNSAVTLGNTAVSLGSTASTVGNLTLGNVTITSGNTSVTYDNAVYQIATANIQAASNAGAFSYGNLSYSDTGLVASFANSTNSSVQFVIQNTNSSSNASTDLVVTNDTATGYLDMGMTSSTYSGSGNFYKANIAYVYSGSSDLYLGTISSNAVHITANNASTDALTVNANNTVTLGTPLGVGSGGTGLSTLTANNVLIGNGTGNVTFVAPGTSGNVLTSNGSVWISQASAGGGNVTIGNTTIGIGNTATSIGNLTLANTTIISGNANVTQLTATGGMIFNANVISSNVTVGVGYNAMSAGNITVANSVVVTVSNLARWVIV